MPACTGTSEDLSNANPLIAASHQASCKPPPTMAFGNAAANCFSLLFANLVMMLPNKLQAAGLSCLARYAVVHPSKNNSWALVVSGGSVVDFSFGNKTTRAAIVNAANEACLGGGGVDGAIGAAGGPRLRADRRALPEIAPGVRCPTGGAVITGPGDYGSLRVPYVIHAVGPNYARFDSNHHLPEADRLLASAYRESLERARETRLEAVAFSLISSGIFRGTLRSKEEVLRIGVEAVCEFEGYDELQEVHLCAHNTADAAALRDIAADLGLTEQSEEQLATTYLGNLVCFVPSYSNYFDSSMHYLLELDRPRSAADVLNLVRRWQKQACSIEKS